MNLKRCPSPPPWAYLGVVALFALGSAWLYFGDDLASRGDGSENVLSLLVDPRFKKYHVGEAHKHSNRTGLPSDEIPKHIWTFWDRCPDQVVLSFIKNWCQTNPGYDITILTLNNYHKYVSGLDLDRLGIKDFPGRISDTVRLHALAQQGGIWVDASMIFTESLDWVRDLQQKMKVEFVGYSISIFETNPAFPVIENWFFACVPRSPLVEAWRKEFMRLQDFPTPGKYIASLMAEGVDLQALDDPEYLAMHAAMQRVLQKGEVRATYRFLVTDCLADGPLYWLAHMKWESKKGMAALVTDKSLHRRIIKIRGLDRGCLTDSQWRLHTDYWNWVPSVDFFLTFGVDYRKQWHKQCHIIDDTCAILSRP